MTLVRIDGASIQDRASFHRAFAAAFSFPDYYGGNFDAWIDCMTDVVEARHEQSATVADAASSVVVVIEDADGFKRRCPDVWLAFLECAAVVNGRSVVSGRAARLVIASL
ncbi:barstar family protein [Nevskia sp.]|uniref:barstar family protein n=1 Tax=Nevskia sp. TaxID=1929292 RepID=UPI0025F192D8|nr:barstar family protein [Nevskia sp.]